MSSSLLPVVASSSSLTAVSSSLASKPKVTLDADVVLGASDGAAVVGGAAGVDPVEVAAVVVALSRLADSQPAVLLC